MRDFKHSTRLVLLCFLFHPLVASATVLEGHIVEYQYFYPDLSSPYPDPGSGNVLVGPGIEVAKIGASDFTGTLDISDTNLFVDFTYGPNTFLPNTFNGFRLTDVLETIPPFSNVTINAATNMVGLVASSVTFDANHIWVNFSGLRFTQDTVVSLDVDVVPEPSTMILNIIALVWYSGRSSRHRSTTNRRLPRFPPAIQ